MVHGIKKQIWLTEEESDLLQRSAQKACLTEAEYIRMLLQNRIPKEKPDAKFYEVMNQVSLFSEQLQSLKNQLRGGNVFDADLLREEIHRWHRFQLTVEERFLAPEKVSWL